MRILHVITDRDRRGAQVYATDLAQGLRLTGMECETVALAPGDHGEKLDVDHLGPRRLAWATLRELRRIASSFDVVVAHGSSTLVACAVALIGTNVPFVYRQISDPLHWASSFARRIRVGLYLRRASGIVALSTGVAKVLEAHYRLRPTAIEVIPNAVPAEAFRPAGASEAAQLRGELGVAPEGTLALTLGALVEEKGTDMAIRSLASNPDLHLLVVGDGPERARLEALAARIAPDRTRFAGSLAEPARALMAADMLLLPSRAGDSMPAVVIEAGLCGLPCITTPVGSITDVVIDEETGLIVPIGDQRSFDEATMRLARNAGQRRALGAQARQKCTQEFTIESTAPAWKRLLETTSGGRSN